MTKYFVTFLSGHHMEASSDDYFGGFIGQTFEPVLWLAIFGVITFVIVLCGVKRGIETANKFMMPILIVLCVAVCVYSCTLPGALEGVKFYLIPISPGSPSTRCWALWGRCSIPCLWPWEL